MSYIVLFRNPSSNGLFAMSEEDGQTITEWETIKQAADAVGGFPVIKAWGGMVVDVDNYTAFI